jgi:hypothetical protein
MNSANFTFCTYFDKKYILQSLALIDSIQRIYANSRIVIFALDSETMNFFKNASLTNVEYLETKSQQKISEKFEAFRLSRSYPESIFSLKPIFIREVLKTLSEDQWVIYLDSDTFLFNSLEIQNIRPDKSIILSPHFFGIESEQFLSAGFYNAGLVGFKNDIFGGESLQLWVNLCEDSCTVDKTNGQYADQKYLEELQAIWPSRVHEIGMGNNLGAWSFSKRTKFSKDQDSLFINGSCLRMFHFHGFKPGLILSITGVSLYGKFEFQSIVKREIHMKYQNSIVENLELHLNNYLKSVGVPPRKFPNIDNLYNLLSLCKRMDFIFSGRGIRVLWKLKKT